MDFVGITERGDAALNEDWVDWVYKKGKPAILITKNAPLLQQNHPDIFFQNVIIHATCTGLGGTLFEPNVPNYKEILDWLSRKNDRIRKNIVLRVDPIIPALHPIGVDLHVLNNQHADFDIKNINAVLGFDVVQYWKNLKSILEVASNLRVRVRISFMDLYDHVVYRLKDCNENLHNYLLNAYKGKLHYPLEKRKSVLDTLKQEYPLLDFEICGEPGMECTGCVSKKDLDILGIYSDGNVELLGNRNGCCCLAMKKELLNTKGQCPHKCLYCYWK